MKQPNNPHDSLFKATFSDREVAQAYLLHFLPKEIIELLELETLSLQSGSYISSSLNSYFSALYWSFYQTDRQCWFERKLGWFLSCHRQ